MKWKQSLAASSQATVSPPPPPMPSETTIPLVTQQQMAYVYTEFPGTSSALPKNDSPIYVEDAMQDAQIKKEQEAASAAATLEAATTILSLQPVVRNNGEEILLQEMPTVNSPEDNRVSVSLLSPSIRYEAIICGECGGSFEKEEDLRIHMIHHIASFIPNLSGTVLVSTASYSPGELPSEEVPPVPSPPNVTTGQKSNPHFYSRGKEKSVATDRLEPIRDGRPRPWVCPVCDKGFRQRGQLEIHGRSHSGEKPYACPQCHKAFRQVAHIQNHMRIHTGERPYACNICEKRFVQQTHLHNHMKSHQRKNAIEQAPMNTVAVADLEAGQGDIKWSDRKSVSIVPAAGVVLE